MKKLYLLLSLLVISFLFLSTPKNILYAQDNVLKKEEIKLESVNPDSFLKYNFKRLKEKIALIFISTFERNQKVPYLIELTNRRLAEFSYIIENSKMSYLENGSSRYVTFIGLLSNELAKNSSYASKIKEGIGPHPEILMKLRDKYPSDTAEWRFVQQAYESAKVLLSKTD